MNTMGVPNNKKRGCDEVAYKEDQKRTFIPMYHFKRGRQERNKRERDRFIQQSHRYYQPRQTKTIGPSLRTHIDLRQMSSFLVICETASMPVGAPRYCMPRRKAASLTSNALWLAPHSKRAFYFASFCTMYCHRQKPLIKLCGAQKRETNE